MRVAFYASEGKKFDESIADAFEAGMPPAQGEGASACPRPGGPGCRTPRRTWPSSSGSRTSPGRSSRRTGRIGRPAVFIDKGYTRIRGGPVGTLYWRVSVNDFQPLRTSRPSPARRDRWDALNIRSCRPAPVRAPPSCSPAAARSTATGRASARPRPTPTGVLAEIRKHTSRPVVYRPKPSWKDAVPIDGSDYSPDTDKFVTRLDDAHCLVTYGSNACFEAVLAGVPSDRPGGRHHPPGVEHNGGRGGGPPVSRAGRPGPARPRPGLLPVDGSTRWRPGSAGRTSARSSNESEPGVCGINGLVGPVSADGRGTSVGLVGPMSLATAHRGPDGRGRQRSGRTPCSGTTCWPSGAPRGSPSSRTGPRTGCSRSTARSTTSAGARSPAWTRTSWPTGWTGTAPRSSRPGRDVRPGPVRRPDRQTLLARDRSGAKPLYYAETDAGAWPSAPSTGACSPAGSARSSTRSACACTSSSATSPARGP
jgi:hypothetical protein